MGKGVTISLFLVDDELSGIVLHIYLIGQAEVLKYLEIF